MLLKRRLLSRQSSRTCFDIKWGMWRRITRMNEGADLNQGFLVYTIGNNATLRIKLRHAKTMIPLNFCLEYCRHPVPSGRIITPKYLLQKDKICHKISFTFY
jgi:hypothetical protein